MCCAGLLLIIRGRPSNKTERGSSRSCCIVCNFLALRKGFCNWADLNFLHKQQHHYILQKGVGNLCVQLRVKESSGIVGDEHVDTVR